MVEAQRALLDELMGTARDLTAEERKAHRETKWDDKEVCGCFLVKFCPHELFVNTKSDLGPCPKIHDTKLKESYEQSTRRDLYVARFEAELFQFCEKLVQDLDRKVRRGRERLAQDVDTSTLIPISTEKSDQLVNIEESIKKFLETIETFGEEGRVDEAEALMKKVDMLNIEKAILTQQISNERGLILSQEKKMALCETCGSFLVVNDATERTQSHMTGKQHVGFGLVRKYLFEYQAQKEKAREEDQVVHEGVDVIPMNLDINGDKEKDKDFKEKEKFTHERNRDRDRERDRDWERERHWKVDHQYRGRNRSSPKRIVRERDRDQDRNRRENNDYDAKTHCRPDWEQRHKIRSWQSSPTMYNTIATLNHYPRHRNHSPDHRV